MNVHEAIRKHYGDGNLVYLRLFVQLGDAVYRQVGFVNKAGMSLLPGDYEGNGRAVYKETSFKIYRISMRKKTLVGYDTILHTRGELY